MVCKENMGTKDVLVVWPRKKVIGTYANKTTKCVTTPTTNLCIDTSLWVGSVRPQNVRKREGEGAQ